MHNGRIELSFGGSRLFVYKLIMYKYFVRYILRFHPIVNIFLWLQEFRYKDEKSDFFKNCMVSIFLLFFNVATRRGLKAHTRYGSP